MPSPLRIGEESAVASTNLSIFTTLENCRLEFTPASQSQLKDGNTCAAICRGISVCGLPMIRRPNTGEALHELATFSCTPVFFSRTYCLNCRTVHEWFANDAWVCDEAEPSAA